MAKTRSVARKKPAAKKSGKKQRGSKRVTGTGTRKSRAKSRSARARISEHALAEARELKEALARASGTGGRRARGISTASRQLSAEERTRLSGVVIYLDGEARKQLARLALDEDRTIQDLGVQAINLLFELYDIAKIA